MIDISVVMPVYNSEKYIAEAIESVIAQTHVNWELLVINEFGSNDDSVKIVKEYQQKDDRIQLIQNKEKLGLAESLNRGIREAKGKYIARLDADDLAHPTRFQKQFDFLEQHKNVILCGTYQHHFGPEIDWIHKPATTPEQCKANFLFFCDICHSTLMFRRDIFIANNLYYDSQYQAEDFELWTRVSNVGDIANIPEVLGEYRCGEDNITNEKKDKLQVESGRIVANTLKRNLKMTLTEKEAELFNNWVNLYQENVTSSQKAERLAELKKMLYRIYKANKKVHCYDEQSLLNVIGTKWRWAKYYEPWNQVYKVDSLEAVFEEKYANPTFNRLYYFWINNKGFKAKIKKILKKMGLKK